MLKHDMYSSTSFEQDMRFNVIESTSILHDMPD